MYVLNTTPWAGYYGNFQLAKLSNSKSFNRSDIFNNIILYTLFSLWKNEWLSLFCEAKLAKFTVYTNEQRILHARLPTHKVMQSELVSWMFSILHR